MTTVKTEPVSPIQMAPKQSEDQLEPETESSLIQPAFSSPSASDLVMATSSGSSTLTVSPVSTPDFSFLETIPMKTLFLKIAPPTLKLAIITILESSQ